MNEAILDKKIKLWEDQLLDLGKRNKMISYRETRRSTLKILKPGFEELYRDLVVEEKELTFQKAIDRDSDVRVYSILTLLDRLSCPMEVNIGDIRAEGSLPEIKKTLKNLRSKARLAMDEQGTNILYLVFGFLEWHEKGGKSDHWLKSPLLLVPVTLLLPAINAQYSLKKQEDEIVVNPTLAYLFERDYGITLPEFDPDKDTLESFMQKMEQLVDDRGWRILRECSVGLVSFLKISMYNDLIRNEQQLKTNPIVRAFAGERNHVNTPAAEDCDFDHDTMRAVDYFQVLDADSSQQDAIMLSKKGISFVMQGPPGTGKSQTITNIIAQGLADGKKILFVSEKMAALDVVYRRLTDVHLADFCLSLHSHKANKKDILSQLGNNLGLQLLKVKDEEIAKLTRLDVIKEQLKAYVQDIHKTVMPLEMSPYEVYGAIMELGNLPDIDLHMADVDRMTKDDVNRLALLVMNMDKAQSVLGPQWYKNPWQGIIGACPEVSQKRELQMKLQTVITVLSALEECQLDEKTLADLITLDTLDRFRSLWDHALHCASVPKGWFSRTTEQEEKTVASLRDLKKQIDDLRSSLLEQYDHGFFDLEAARLLADFTDAMNRSRSILRHVSSDEEAFDRLEDDRKQLLQLRDAERRLMDFFGRASKEYQLELPCEASSIETLLTLCGMLLEKRDLTAQYFGTGNLCRLKQELERVRSQLEQLVQIRQHLTGRYGSAFLDAGGIGQQLQQLTQAMAVPSLLYGNGEPEYAAIKSVADFDIQRLHHVEEARNDSVFAQAAAGYHIAQPSTLCQVKQQMLALGSLEQAEAMEPWKTSAGRETATVLLTEMAQKTEKLAELQESLRTFLAEAGIVIDADKLCAGDIRKLYRAKEAVPEFEILLESSANPDTDRLLDSIEEKKAGLVLLSEEIARFRQEYGIAETLDGDQLLTALLERREDTQGCLPLLCWAQTPEKVYALLDQLTARAKALREEHDRLMQTCEPTVFTVDATGMLNRFKAEYTTIFKVFKASYKEDVKQIRLVFKEVRKKISDEEIIALLQTLRKYNEALADYRSLSAQAAELLDVRDYDIRFAWEDIRRRLDAFSRLCPVFISGKHAHRFVTEAPWDEILTKLTQYRVVNQWFEDNAARKRFGLLYQGSQTETEVIRQSLSHIRSMVAIFRSGEHYLQFVRAGDREKTFLHAVKMTETMVELRQWFHTQSQRIMEYTGIRYEETSDRYKNVAAALEAYEALVTAFGEPAAYAMATTGRSDVTLLQRYPDTLRRIATVEACAREICHTDVIGEDMAKMEIGTLIAELHRMIGYAKDLVAVYAFAEPYCLSDAAALPAEELKKDLEALCFYQDTCKQLPQLHAQSREMIGAQYRDFATDWETVDADIRFAQKVNELLDGNVSAPLVQAFVKLKTLYGQEDLSQLRQDFEVAGSLNGSYRQIGAIRDLQEKSRVLSEVLVLLERAAATTDAVACHAFAQCRYDCVVGDLRRLTALQNGQATFARELSKGQQMMPTFGLSGDTDWDAAVEVFEHVKQIKRAVNAGGLDEELIRWLTNGMAPVLPCTYKDRIEKLVRYQTHFTDITGLFENRTAMEGFPLTKLGRRLRNCNEQFATMDAWIDLRDCKKACRDSGLADFVLKAEDAYYPEGALKDVFLKSFYYAWFETVCANIESVANFRVRTQNMRVETFRELDAHQLPVDQMRIRERLIRDMPNRHSFGRATDEMSVLLHELNKKRNIMPLRKLFRAIPNLLLRLKPCLMMSPLSVAHFLEAETYRFDMVIFDEASQIFPQDAIGAIFRAKQVIIAGDSKQLPPTNFFAASTNNDADFDVDDEEEEEIIFDSILEEASNSLLNQSLLWHYRSRYEELIAFSNREIYQNNLITFPSSTIRVPDTGVEYLYVKDGVYEGRSNRAEARRIVQLVAEHIRKYPDRSLGIIAFSESQQSTIEEEIDQFRAKNRHCEPFFDEDRDEPFFVKNLENVQGDERDTIIFSICYGKNPQGRMFMRFGPLGHQGGERRLNVAITRAKRNVKLVGSIMPEDIDLSKTQSQGVRMLRAYIGFAMHGGTLPTKHEKKNCLYDVDTFSQQVGKFLIRHGCQVQMNVGNSDYTVDIAVEHPKRPGHYIAGIECDGNSYCLARTVRDRDHLRTAVLEQMGWRMYRVWSTEWIRNPAAEQERLLQFIRDAQQRYGEDDDTPATGGSEDIVGTETVTPQSVPEAVDPENPYGFPKYREGKWWEVVKYRAADELSMLADRILAVVKVEQPIHMDLLYRRLADIFRMTKATQMVRDAVDDAIRLRMSREIYLSDGFVYLTDGSEVKVRRSDLGHADRIIEHIAIPEIAAAMERILVGTIGMERSVLCAEAARVFGFERNGPKIKQRTNEAVDYLVMNKKVRVADDKVHLLEDE